MVPIWYHTPAKPLSNRQQLTLAVSGSAVRSRLAPPAIAKKMLCRLRLSVRTLGFHPSKRSSILLGDAIHLKAPYHGAFLRLSVLQ